MFQPSPEILKKYADVLIKFALNSWEWAKKWEVVWLRLNESAKPFLSFLQQAILESGAHYILQYSPEGAEKTFYDFASDEQIAFFPDEHYLQIVKSIDHSVFIDSTDNKYLLKDVAPTKLMNRQKVFKNYMEARNKKENEGKFTWTLWLYGTEAMASDVWLTLEEYWGEIINACYLDEVDPIAKWREVFAENIAIQQKLNALQIRKVHVVAEDTDLHVTIGEQRQWLGGSGRNIPSFEIFTSPDWRGTNGWIRFNQPLYRYGNIITGIRLEFKDGKIISATADKNESLLREMIAVEGADKIGEFSLTDGRMSRITKFMGETLYDENVGWPFWNTHIAVGASYHETFTGDVINASKEELAALGFNESAIHTDIMSTTDRTVTATLADGREMVIYQDGKFVL